MPALHRILLPLGLSALAAPALAQPDPAAACAALAGRVVAAEAIGLPSGGASVGSATWAPDPAQPPHCRLLGEVAPLDPAAPPIRFQVNIPPAGAWNGRGLQYGGSGLNGTLVTGLAALRDAPPGTPTPLARGYATWGTDSGHPFAGLPAGFRLALHDESLRNFAYASYKIVRDVAGALVTAHQGRAPERVYLFGGSQGGREALLVAQRFPADFDGVVSVVPVINWVGLQLSGAHRGGTVQREGGWIPPAGIAALGRSVLAQCDALDGLEDGVVGHVQACAARFDPAALRCAGAAAPDCLTEAQIATVRTLHAPFPLPYAQAHGLREYPGFFPGGEDQPDGAVLWATGQEPPAWPIGNVARQGRLWTIGAGMISHFVRRDPAFAPFGFDAAGDAARLAALSAMMDATDPDLSAFAARGGRVILKENLSDFAQSPGAGIAYHRAVAARMGQAAAEGVMRLYAVPGATHAGRVQSGRDGRALPSHVDLLALLEAWVERGEAPPEAPVLTAHAPSAPFAVTATRPMCRWPAFPRFEGGDPERAESFRCVAP